MTNPAEPAGRPDELAGAYGRMLDRHVEPEPSGVPPAETPPEPSAPPPLGRIVEALLFVGGAPLTAGRAAEAVRGLTAEQLVQAIDQLNRAYRAQARPYRIQARDQGYELALLP